MKPSGKSEFVLFCCVFWCVFNMKTRPFEYFIWTCHSSTSFIWTCHSRTSFELKLLLFDYLWKPHELTFVAITSLLFHLLKLWNAHLPADPSLQPSMQPSIQPSSNPTISGKPSLMPSDSPSLSSQPSHQPSMNPSARLVRVCIDCFVICEFNCSIWRSLGSCDLATSFELHLPLFDCLCKPHVLTEVTIYHLSLSFFLNCETYSHWPSSQPSKQPSMNPSSNPTLSAEPSTQPSMNPSASHW